MDLPTATRSIRKPRGQGASRRGEILDAAKRLFLTEGFERATIRKIAEAVGVSSGTLYLYFPAPIRSGCGPGCTPMSHSVWNTPTNTG
jgi:hypothetical protein